MLHTSLPTVYHITHQKAGSQWVRAILQGAQPYRIVTPTEANLQFTHQPALPGMIYPTLYVTRAEFEAVAPPEPQRSFVVIRDVRDTVVSYYHSMLSSHVPTPNVLNLRRLLEQLSPGDGLHYVAQTFGVRTARFQRSWLASGVPVYRYEDLLADPFATFRAIFDVSQIEISDARLHSLIEQHAFARVTGGRKRGTEDRTSHQRKGVAGDWTNVFDDALRAWTRTAFNDVLLGYGYESDADWSPALPATPRPACWCGETTLIRENPLQARCNRCGSLAYLHTAFHKLGYTFKQRLKPRLGTLVHHAPRPLEIPPRYYRAPRMTASALPRISIVTPSLNSRAFIRATLDSVLSQEYPNLEYIVQDGGSDDGTLDLLAAYTDRLAAVHSRPDNGQSHALNLGFANTSGEIMAYLNADDILLPGALAYVGHYFASHPHVDAVYGHRVLIDAAGDEIGRWVLPRHDNTALAYADYIPQETLFWRRRLWEAAGGHISEALHYTMDWELLLRFLDAEARIVRLPRFLGAFRVHDGQKTGHPLALAEMGRLRRSAVGRHIDYEEINAALRGYMARHVIHQKLYRLGVLRY